MESLFPDGELTSAAELGAVDAQGVRVWVRRPGARTAPVRLEVAGRPPVETTIALEEGTDWTGAARLALDAPAPGAPFTCIAGEDRLHGHLAPLPGARTGLTFAFGSCHQPYELGEDGRIRLAPRAGIYPAMREELQRARASFLLLAGDQLYSDELPPVSVRSARLGDAEHPPPLEVAVEAYRRVTRGYLGQSGFRRLRETFPTYCIWDDHDIFDSWGSRLEKTPRDRRLFEAAGRVYGEYQHTRNPDGAIGPPPYHYTFQWGDIGFLVLDVRGARDYQHGQLLGDAQWTAVQAYLAGDEAARLQTLFVVTSVPIAHVSRWMAAVFDRLSNSHGDAVRDRWCSAAFVRSRDALLDALFEWESRAAGRQVFLLSGDVHAASAFTIRRRRGSGVVYQLTSSALTTPTTFTKRVLSTIATRCPNLLEPRIALRRHFLLFPNNYGLLRLAPLPEGGHRVRLDIRAWEPRTRRLSIAARLTAAPGDRRDIRGRPVRR